MINTYLFDFQTKTIKSQSFDNISLPKAILDNYNFLLYWICKQIFPEYSIIDHQRFRNKKGLPDFQLLNFDNGKSIYVEMKLIGSCGLNYDQLKFMFENKDCYVLCYSIDDTPYEKFVRV